MFLTECVAFCSGFKGVRFADLASLRTPFYISIKLRLHYNELAQRTATVWRYLTFVGIRWYTLKKSDECDQ